MDKINPTDQEVDYLLGVAQAGINKSWSEGFYEWSNEEFGVLLHERVDLEDPRVQAGLQEWEKAGVIQLVGKEDVYFKVLKPFN